MKWLKWQDGRQDANGNYKKLLLCILGIPGLFGFDIYIIKFKPDYKLPEHIDRVSWGNHYRLNIVLYGSGEFKCEKTIINQKRLVLFRPDLYTHSMENGSETRVLLSIGVAHK